MSTRTCDELGVCQGAGGCAGCDWPMLPASQTDQAEISPPAKAPELPAGIISITRHVLEG